jgi:hypothetical protein
MVQVESINEKGNSIRNCSTNDWKAGYTKKCPGIIARAVHEALAAWR